MFQTLCHCNKSALKSLSIVLTQNTYVMKIRNIILSILLLVSCIPTQAQWGKKIKGDGNLTSENRNVADYDEISVNGNIKVVLINGKEGNITLEGEKNILDNIELVTKNDKLIIKSKDHVELRPSKGKDIRITVPIEQVSKLSLNGSGEIEGTFPLKSDAIKLQVNGSGDLEVALDATNVKASVTGSGDIEVSGKADYFEAVVTGSGDIDGNELIANICEGKVVGSGDIKFHAEEELDAKIVGSGDIEINKTVKRIEKKIVGSGDVTKK